MSSQRVVSPHLGNAAPLLWSDYRKPIPSTYICHDGLFPLTHIYRRPARVPVQAPDPTSDRAIQPHRFGPARAAQQCRLPPPGVWRLLTCGLRGVVGSRALTTETIVDGDNCAPEPGSVLTYPAVLQDLRDGLFYLLRRQINDRALAEDLCNEAFRIVLERVQHQPLADPTKLAAFLAQTARNLLTAEQRKAIRRRTDTGAQAAIDEYPDAAADADEALHLQACRRAIHEVLRKMRHIRDRELLVRYYLHNEDKETICRHFGLTEDHFNRVLFRARERFRGLLERRFSKSDLLCLALL